MGQKRKTPNRIKQQFWVFWIIWMNHSLWYSNCFQTGKCHEMLIFFNSPEILIELHWKTRNKHLDLNLMKISQIENMRPSSNVLRYSQAALFKVSSPKFVFTVIQSKFFEWTTFTLQCCSRAYIYYCSVKIWYVNFRNRAFHLKPNHNHASKTIL